LKQPPFSPHPPPSALGVSVNPQAISFLLSLGLAQMGQSQFFTSVAGNFLFF